MKTLIIHPADFSTSFLTDIYDGKGFEVVNTDVSRRVLKDAVKSHERIVMLGHGSENGMFGYDKFVVHKDLVYHLRSKPQSIYVWCYASDFLTRYGLKGLTTGMFISEYEEALLLCMKPDYDQIQRSNALFAKLLNESIDKPVKEIYDYLKARYAEEDSQTIAYNSERLRLFV